ncbi:hypothetical protein [Sulfurimonas sp. HSL3-7]|uniref:hypothetical protein n=1 Tax=Sulfonitrofixus jiaomeiensis TaxID=3131938 RepID=UPI0031F7B246
MAFNLKHYIFRAFRELLLYHHSSLEFRAKLFAALIAANENYSECELDIVRETGMALYGEADRANTLRLTVEEYLDKVFEDNGLAIDELIEDIMNDLKDIPRYADKISIDDYRKIIACCEDEENRIYQERIVDLYQRLKDDYEKRRK